MPTLPEMEKDLSSGILTGWVRTYELTVQAHYGFSKYEIVAEFSSDLKSVKISKYWMRDKLVNEFLENLLAEIKFTGEKQYTYRF